MFRKILIANRGEIALRIIRACREMGIRSIIAHSEADRDSLPVRVADEHICIGPAASGKSYLNIPNIISAALITNADAIHPGYGFLAENTSFAEICADAHITFIGPPASVMAILGDKVAARETMSELGMPMLPGTPTLRTLAEGIEVAREIGFPLMLKAAAGGGGRGIRLVKRADEFERVFTTAQNEVREAFRDDGLYLERYLEHARHVEIQVLVDNFGHGVHLGERNCSCQRRNQKVLEESPSPHLPPELRQEMGWSQAPTLSRSRSVLRPGCLSSSSKKISSSVVTPSSAGLQRRMQITISARKRVWWRNICLQVVQECVSIATSTRAMQFHRTMTPCWPNSSSGRKRAKRQLHACSARSVSL